MLGSGGAEIGNYFQTVGVPELRNQALHGESPSDQVKAVLALTNAGDLESLKYVAENATNPRVKEAARSAASRPDLLSAIAGRR
jgi:hypothetical protein